MPRSPRTASRTSRGRTRRPDRTYRFDDLAGFMMEVERVVHDWTPPRVEWYLQPWFRGHVDATWSLSPGLYRLRTVRGLGAEYYTEQELLDSFKLRAPPYLPRLPRSDWEWLFLMQHYGLPTRLLDWTESALVALYFAVAEHDGRGDSAVWAINPWWINKQAFGKYELFSADSPCAAPWAPGKLADKVARAPIALRPAHESARIQAQRGVFTIHGSERGGLDALAEAGDDACIRKLVLPGGAVASVRRELSVAGISESAVFPELPGLCRDLKRFFFGA